MLDERNINWSTTHCNVENPANGSIVNSSQQIFANRIEHGDIVQYECRKGFILDGSYMAFCENGILFPVAPECKSM